MIYTNTIILLFMNIHLFMFLNQIMFIFRCLLNGIKCLHNSNLTKKSINMKINDINLLKIVITIDNFRKSYQGIMCYDQLHINILVVGKIIFEILLDKLLYLLFFVIFLAFLYIGFLNNSINHPNNF